MKRIGRQRVNSWRLKALIKGTQKGGLTSIEVPDLGRWDNSDWVGTWKEVNTKEEMENGCLQENERKIRQTGTTFFLQQEIIDIVGPLGLSQEASNFQYTGRKGILGLYADPIVNCYLDKLELPWAVKEYGPFEQDFSTEAHIRGWQHMKEGTSSSFSKLHFGHYIASSFDLTLAAMDASMDSHSAKTGHVFPRWEKAINVMLQKKTTKQK
jgi:hypothetical protein